MKKYRKASKAEKKRARIETERITSVYRAKWQRRHWKVGGIGVWYCERETARRNLKAKVLKLLKRKPTKRNDRDRVDHR